MRPSEHPSRNSEVARSFWRHDDTCHCYWVVPMASCTVPSLVSGARSILGSLSFIDTLSLSTCSKAHSFCRPSARDRSGLEDVIPPQPVCFSLINPWSHASTMVVKLAGLLEGATML